MPNFAFVRLGPGSADKSRKLAEAPPGIYPETLILKCAQVPSGLETGSQVWIWLGSDNNKGQQTEWAQGIRAIGVCEEKNSLGSAQYSIKINNIFMLPRSVQKQELLQESPELYARSLSEAPIVGLNNYSSQVVQLISANESATIAAIIARLIPEVRETLFGIVPAAAKVELIERPPANPSPSINRPDLQPIIIPDDDPVFTEVRRILEDDELGGALLIGSPGTGKTWYARQIARKLTSDKINHVREIQFHSSYQYEDFVEGYVPDAALGFRMAPKHLLEMVEIAEATTEPVVILIDEFSRTDPSRVLGETLTYMDGPMRGITFHLPSGRKTAIPKNLIFLATMNPDDRSVDEIDDAMDRRWGKILIAPDADRVREFLIGNGAEPKMIAPTIKFFHAVQKHMPIGHAFFRRVKDTTSLDRLWRSQLSYQVKKRFRFDAHGMAEITALWDECRSQIEAKGSGTDGDPNT